MNGHCWPGLDDLSLESPASPHDLRLPGVMTFHPALQAAVPRLEVPSHRIQGGGSGYFSSQQNIQGQSRRFCTGCIGWYAKYAADHFVTSPIYNTVQNLGLISSLTKICDKIANPSIISYMK